MFDNSRSKGNVLFLILIAVALFAALSYAVVSSNRGGNGDTKKDKSHIQAGEFTGYFTSLVNNYQRYYMSSGTSGIAAGGVGNNVCGGPSNNCFWYYNPSISKSINSNGITYALKAVGSAQNRGVAGIGVAAGDDIIWLEGIPEDVCTLINKALGITGIPVNPTLFPSATGISITPHQVTACIKNSDGTIIYYYVMLAA